jgi:AraC-like DNA-binding protein
MTRHDLIPLDPDPPRPDPRAPDVIHLRQGVRAQFRAVVGEVPVILRVEAGRKVIRGAAEAEVPAGHLTLMPSHLPLDVENHPASDGPYRATALLIAPGIAAPTGPRTAGATADARALAAFDRALDLCRRPATPSAIRDHAVMEVLLWLDTLGLRLPPQKPPSLSDRIRALVGADLARDWPAAEVARAHGLSEATLRRHLAEEGAGLSVLLIDLRMNRALGLLQATDLPVQEIAFQVGYASPSRFALRFRARYGLAPSAIRGERGGTSIDRPGIMPVRVQE